MAPAPAVDHDGHMEAKRMTSSNRLLVVMGLGLVGLIVVAAIIVAFRDPAEFEPGSPEAATQAYVQAILDEDAAAAHARLTPALQRRCTVEDLEERHYWRDAGRITLVDSKVKTDAAVIKVKFTAAYSDGAFDYYQSSYEERFELEMVDGEWRISSATWPFYWCREV